MHEVRDPEFLKFFGNNLRKARKGKGVSQEKLAEKAGISQVQIARLESGRLNTSISTVKVIIQALDISADELFRK